MLKLLLLASLLSALAAGAAEGRTRPLADILGVSHVCGKYHFTSTDFLNEGADQLLPLGTRVLKIWFSRPDHDYAFNSSWPKTKSLVEMAQAPYYKTLFAKPFTTFVLETYAPGRDDHYFKTGFTPDDAAREKAQFYEFTKYLLTTYKHTGKTFVLQNWEGDWGLTFAGCKDEPSPVAVQGMIDWLNARQDGVAQARQELGEQGVTVAHAAEVNLVARAMAGRITVTNNVLPKTHCDLYAYSAYDTSLDRDPAKFRAALEYLKSKAPDSALYGQHNIYVGEFGVPENEFGGPAQQLAIVKRNVETALDFGARYIIYWQLYCNEFKKGQPAGRPGNADLRGFWLIRPDGSKSPVWDYFAGLVRRNAP